MSAVAQRASQGNQKTMNLITLINRCLRVACLLAAVCQVLLVNSMSITGHEIAELESQIASLKIQNQQLSNQSSQLQNLERISLRALELGLTPNTTALTLQGPPPIAMSNQ